MQTTDAEVATAEQRILAAEQRAKAAGAAAAAEKAKADAPKAAKALAEVQKVTLSHLAASQISESAFLVSAALRRVRVCPRQAKAVSIEGHPDSAYNGLYTHDSTHEGWPVLKNAMGTYCFRYKASDQWRLSDKARHDEDICLASIVAKEGPLPVGAHTWQVISGGKWVQRTLTVALVPA